MAKPYENKRKKYSNLSEAEAEDRRKRVNQKERDRQNKKSEVIDKLEVALFKTAGAKRKSKLQILNAALEYITQKEKCAADTIIVGDQTTLMYPNNRYQEQNIVQPVQHLGFPSNPEMPAVTNNFPVDPFTSAGGYNQPKFANDTKQQTNFYPGRNHSYFEDSSNFQGCIFNNEVPSIGPSIYMEPNATLGASMQVGLSGSDLPALASSTDNPIKLQELLSYIQPFELLDKMYNDNSAFTGSAYVLQNISLSSCVNSGNMTQNASQTSQNAPQNISVSGNVSSSNMMQNGAETTQNAPQNISVSRYLSSPTMVQDASTIHQYVPQNINESRYAINPNMMQETVQTSQNVPENVKASSYMSSPTMIQDTAQTPQNVTGIWPICSTFF